MKRGSPVNVYVGTYTLAMSVCWCSDVGAHLAFTGGCSRSACAGAAGRRRLYNAHREGVYNWGAK